MEQHTPWAYCVAYGASQKHCPPSGCNVPYQNWQFVRPQIQPACRGKKCSLYCSCGQHRDTCVRRMVRRRISIFVSVITIGVTFLALNVPSRGRSEWLADWCASSRVLGVRTCVFFFFFKEIVLFMFFFMYLKLHAHWHS